MPNARGVPFAWLSNRILRPTRAPSFPKPRLVPTFFRAAFEETSDAMLAIGGDGGVIDANPAACELFEQSREQIVGIKLGELIHRAAEDEPVAPSESGGFASVSERPARFVRRDGLERTLEVSIRSDVIPGTHLVVVRDQTERQSLRASLIRADRLSTFGMLASGMAHEINNPLMYAMNNLRTVLRRMPDWANIARQRTLDDLAAVLEHAARMLATADEGMGRIASLVRDLRVASHEGDAREPVDVKHVLDSCINIAYGEIRQRARIVRDYDDTAMIDGNAGRLGQVFLNLLVNAAQAIPEGVTGEIHVATRNWEPGRVVIEVSDNGVGIAPNVVAHIFEPFFTTKRLGEGTGLGLCIARSIVADLGGTVQVESTPGIGTTMRITLRACAGSPQRNDAGSRQR